MVVKIVIRNLEKLVLRKAAYRVIYRTNGQSNLQRLLEGRQKSLYL